MGLAERKQKNRLSADPRNTFWASDKSKFGYRMLMKMGWSEGKGLGILEDGTVDHVKIQHKEDQLGIGASKKNDDNWLVHTDAYNSLLASLNDVTPSTIGSPSITSSSQPFSAQTGSDQDLAEAVSVDQPKGEEVKAKPKARPALHRSKYLKAKQQAMDSERDLSMILGIRSTSLTTYQTKDKAFLKEKIDENTPSLIYDSGTLQQNMAVCDSHDFMLKADKTPGVEKNKDPPRCPSSLQAEPSSELSLKKKRDKQERKRKREERRQRRTERKARKEEKAKKIKKVDRNSDDSFITVNCKPEKMSNKTKKEKKEKNETNMEMVKKEKKEKKETNVEMVKKEKKAKREGKCR